MAFQGARIPRPSTVAYMRTFKVVGEDAEKQLGVEINGRLESIPAQRVARNQNLHRLGARKRIAELERLNVDGSKDDAIGKLALEFRLVSSRTSFVAIDATSGTKAQRLTTAMRTEPCAEREDARMGGIREPSIECAALVAELESKVLMTRCCSLEGCSALDMNLSRSPVNFSRALKSTPGRSVANIVFKLVSRVVSQLASLGGSLMKPKATETILGPRSQVPMKASALQGKHNYFEGRIHHTSFGPEELALKLLLDKVERDQYLGRWIVMGQAKTIVLTCDPATGAVTIRVQDSQSIVLQGKLDSKMGSISGEVIQAGVSGGRFHLQPLAADVELTDTFGDHLV